MTYITDAVEVLSVEFPGADISASENHLHGGCWFSIRLPGWSRTWHRGVEVDLAKDHEKLRTFFRIDVAHADRVLRPTATSHD